MDKVKDNLLWIYVLVLNIIPKSVIEILNIERSIYLISLYHELSYEFKKKFEIKFKDIMIKKKNYR